jgi:hypothetical protein
VDPGDYYKSKLPGLRFGLRVTEGDMAGRLRALSGQSPPCGVLRGAQGISRVPPAWPPYEFPPAGRGLSGQRRCKNRQDRCGLTPVPHHTPDTPVGVGVETVVANRDLSLARYVRGDPGNEVQVVHLHAFGIAASTLVYPLALGLIEGKTP